MTTEKIDWLIQYWEAAAQRSKKMALTVSGEGEAVEIYQDTTVALKKLRDIVATGIAHTVHVLNKV